MKLIGLIAKCKNGKVDCPKGHFGGIFVEKLGELEH